MSMRFIIQNGSKVLAKEAVAKRAISCRPQLHSRTPLDIQFHERIICSISTFRPLISWLTTDRMLQKATESLRYKPDKPRVDYVSVSRYKEIHYQAYAVKCHSAG